MKHEYSAVNENVLLRPLTEEHIELLRKWRNTPQNTEFLNKVPYITKEMQENWFENYLLNRNEMAFAIIETRMLKRMVGSISLLNFSENRVECGHIMVGDEEAHGKQVCENAIKAALKIAFNEMNMKEVYLYVFKDNIKAVCVYEKVGFKITGRFKTRRGEELLMILKNSVK